MSHSSVMSLLVQKEFGDKQGNWITALQEYDLEINPAKLLKGQGLCKLAKESHGKEVEDMKVGGKMKLS